MSILKDYVKDPLHVEKLQEFCSLTVEGKSEFYRYVIRERRNMVEVLHDFHGQEMPLEWIIQLAGKQKPREFSISSSDQLYKGQKHITMAVAEYQTPFKRDIKGICSYWLAHKAE